MSAGEAHGSILQEKCRDLLPECWTVDTEVPTCLIDVLQMAMYSITLEKKKREIDLELQNTQHESQAASSAVSEPKHIASSNSEEARSCRQHLEYVEEQLDLALEKVTSIGKASADAAL